MSYELDLDVATKVMGWPVVDRNKRPDQWPYVNAYSESSIIFAYPKKGHPFKKWSPSTDPAAAMEVIEEMCEKAYDFMGDGTLEEKPEGKGFLCKAYEFVFYFQGEEYDWQPAPTLPEAICRAALVHFENEVKE